jgi:superfamily II DNA or RNA helicase
MKLFEPAPRLHPLRPYQQACLDKARAHIHAGAQSVLVCMPTGVGKTRTAVEACLGHVRLDGLPLFVAPRRELVAQATATLLAAGLAPERQVFVRTIQELTQPGASIPPATMVVLDEARHYVADAWSSIRKALPEAVYLGLDATPERGDGRGLGGMFDVLVEAISVKEAIAGGFLVPCEVLRPERPLGPRELAQDPLEAYLAHAAGTSAVVFCSSVEEAQKLSDRFNERGVMAEAAWGEMHPNLRNAALRRFAEGRIRVLTNMHLLTEGWDAPITETVILARGFPTVGAMLQATGRGLRPHPGKCRCLLIDLTGCTHLHGEPDEERSWHLEGRAARRASESVDLRWCPICGAVVLAGAACEQCGYSGAEMKKRKPRVLGLPIDRFARERAMPEERQLRELAGLMRAARARGYREGWAVKIWSHKFGRAVTSEMKRAARSLG